MLLLLKPDHNVYQGDDHEHVQSIALEKGQDTVACRKSVRSSSCFFWREARILGLEIHYVAPCCIKRHFRIAPVQLVAAGGVADPAVKDAFGQVHCTWWCGLAVFI